MAAILRELAEPLEYKKRAAMITTKAEIEALLLQNKDFIRSLGVERIGVFGSFASGNQTGASDIDFMVVFAPGRKSFRSFMDLADFLEERAGRRIELLTPESLAEHVRGKIMAQVFYVPLAA